MSISEIFEIHYNKDTEKGTAVLRVGTFWIFLAVVLVIIVAIKS